MHTSGIAKVTLVASLIACGFASVGPSTLGAELFQSQSSEGFSPKHEDNSDQQQLAEASQAASGNMAAESGVVDQQRFPVGTDPASKSIKWVDLLSRKLNEDGSLGYRVDIKSGNKLIRVGSLSLDCEHKKLAYRPRMHRRSHRAQWVAITPKTPVEALAFYVCRDTPAAPRWGYAEATKYLWGASVPASDPANASGDWVVAINNDEAESFWNNNAIRLKNAVIVSTYARSKGANRSTGSQDGNAQYGWLIASCVENLYAVNFRPYPSLDGIWAPPRYGRPGGVSMAVRKRFCR
ncbi:hypothetical protein NZK27_10635 [Synechococcus sp. FGCU-3]|nr:hypothetical protein [Synechococcus sp. FGCU3]